MPTHRHHTLVLATALALPMSVAAETKLETEDQKTIYALGLVVANQLKGFNLTTAGRPPANPEVRVYHDGEEPEGATEEMALKINSNISAAAISGGEER